MYRTNRLAPVLIYREIRQKILITLILSMNGSCGYEERTIKEQKNSRGEKKSMLEVWKLFFQ